MLKLDLDREEISLHGRICWALSAVGAGVLLTGLLLEHYWLAGTGLFWLAGFGASGYIEFLKSIIDPDA
jgi:hypothetical protein